MKNPKVPAARLLVALAALVFVVGEAHAGVFNIPRFINKGENSIGIEPEVTFTNDGGVAGNVKYQHGVTDLNNVIGTLGYGGGVRKFRLGAAFTFDAIPDIDRQPGMGIALQGIYYRYRHFGQFDLTLVPYIHKTFYNGAGQEIEPFVAVPVGPEMRSREYNWAATAVLGAMFREKDASYAFVGEVGVSINKAETYASAGVIFYPGRSASSVGK